MNRVAEKYHGRACRKCGGTELYSSCYACVRCHNEQAAARKRTPQYRAVTKAYWMQRRYGITPEQMDQMLAAQGNKCGCCEATEPGNKNGWCVDHDHATGEVRAILCHGCNVGLGAFKDSPARLHAALAYLEKWPGLRACTDESAG